MSPRVNSSGCVKNAGLRLKLWLHLFCISGLPFVAGSLVAQTTEEKFPSLTVGTNTYRNVVVLNKTRADVFVQFDGGMANFKVKELDVPTQLKLGYQVEQPKPSNVEKVLEITDVTRLEQDPHVQELQEKFGDDIGELAERIDDRTAYIIIGSIIFAYLLFSFLCRQVCVKTGNPPSLLIWLPFFKQIPLLKAAGMSGWWILTNFLPGIFLITYILWSFKIVRARAKHIIFAVMLLFPITNLLAFLYLALSGDGSEKPSRSVISLQSSPRREAA